MPQILQQLGSAQQSSQMTQIKQMMELVRNARNPAQMLSKIASSNPQVNQVMKMVEASGDPKKAFYELARQKGVNPNDILNLLK